MFRFSDLVDLYECRGSCGFNYCELMSSDLVDIKFRLYDGSDVGPFRYSSTSTVDMLKERVVSDWPKGAGSLFLYLCLINSVV